MNFELENEKTRTSRYLIVSTLIGLLIGLTTAELFGLSHGLPHLIWSGILATIGFLLTWLFRRHKKPIEEIQNKNALSKEKVLFDYSRKKQSSTIRILTFRREGLSVLKQMQVDSGSGATSAPKVELNIMMEDFSFQARIPVLEGVLKRMSAKQLAERIAQDIISKCPKTIKEPNFVLTALRSEGPIFDDGRCLAGWSFHFVDGLLGFQCIATTTESEILLQYQTTVSYDKPEPGLWSKASIARALVIEHFPQLAERNLYYHYILPNQVSIFIKNPLFILDVDTERRTIRNLVTMQKRINLGLTPENERFALDDVLAWIRGEIKETMGAHFEAALEGKRFKLGIHTLDEKVIQRVGRAILEAEGPDVITRLAEIIRKTSNTEDQITLIKILSYIPSRLAIVALQRLSTTSILTKPDAEALFKQRAKQRPNQQTFIASSPFERFSFEEIRIAMGKTQLVPLALKSTYNPDLDLLEPLREIGLSVSNRRLLSGSSFVNLSANLRSGRGDTEAFLSSVPLPVPCHVLYLVGTSVNVFEKRILATNIAYLPEDILTDATSQNPTIIHKACLYLEALQLSPRELSPLQKAYKSSQRDKKLRQAILRVLIYMKSQDAEDFLSKIAKNEDDSDQNFAKNCLREREKEKEKEKKGKERS